MPTYESQPTGALSTLARSQTLDRLDTETFDCVVVGGGITGAGVAREATGRGLRVALLEREDFASGTSSRSTQLIHGGLRYIAMGDLALVRRTARERKILYSMAPHLAQRRWMVVPARSRTELLKLQAGITVYELLGAVEREDRHFQWNVSKLVKEEPLLDRSRSPFACVYREYLTHDCRLVLANLRAAVDQGAAVLNHLSVDRVIQEGGEAAGVEARCRFTGRQVRVQGRCVVNVFGSLGGRGAALGGLSGFQEAIRDSNLFNLGSSSP